MDLLFFLLALGLVFYGARRVRRKVRRQIRFYESN